MLKIGRPIYKRLFKSNRVLGADQKSDVNQTCQQSVFSPMGACIRIWCTEGAWNDRPKCLSTGSHPFPSLSSRFFHPFPKQRACSQAKFYMNMTSFSYRLIKFVSLASSRFIHGRFHTYNGWALFPKCKLKSMCLPLKRFLLVAIPWMPLSKNRKITCQI